MARSNYVGFENLIRKLGSRQQAAARAMHKTVRVGYSAPYALAVHENMEIDHEAHGCGGQAKFLEQPARVYREQMAKIVRAEVVARGEDEPIDQAILRGMLAAGEFLKVQSQELVPVQTGNLKNSAFVWIEDR